MNKKMDIKNTGIGVGYVSVMIIFAVICLTIFAVFSFRAASSDDTLNERSGKYLREYYAADVQAKEILAELDECAQYARESDSFDRDFMSAVADMENITLQKTESGYTADYSVDVNDRQRISVSVEFTGSGYEIVRWQNVSASNAESEQHANVWMGGM